MIWYNTYCVFLKIYLITTVLYEDAAWWLMSLLFWHNKCLKWQQYMKQMWSEIMLYKGLLKCSCFIKSMLRSNFKTGTNLIFMINIQYNLKIMSYQLPYPSIFYSSWNDSSKISSLFCIYGTFMSLLSPFVHYFCLFFSLFIQVIIILIEKW